MTVGEVVKADSPVLRTGEPAYPEHTKPFDKPYFLTPNYTYNIYRANQSYTYYIYRELMGYTYNIYRAYDEGNAYVVGDSIYLGR